MGFGYAGSRIPTATGSLLLRAILLSTAFVGTALTQETPAVPAASPSDTAANRRLVIEVGSENLQDVIDRAPPHATLLCDPTVVMTLSTPILIQKPLTLRGLHARLPDGLGKTPLVLVRASAVTISDFELHGNESTVPASVRAPLVSIDSGNFTVERGRLFNSSKDGVEITPRDGGPDIIGGVLRDLVGDGVVRDVVSISGGGHGGRVKNVVAENIRSYRSRVRGAVEVSDGTDNITVRDVYAEDCLYAVDVQDHGRPQQTNRNVVIENVVALKCRFAVLTANGPHGHRNLSIRNVTAERCIEAVRIKNTTLVRLENVRVIDHVTRKNKPLHPISILNCDGVSVRDVTVRSTTHRGTALLLENCDGVLVDGLSLLGTTETLAHGLLYRISVAKGFSGLRVANVFAPNCREAGIHLEVTAGAVSETQRTSPQKDDSGQEEPSEGSVGTLTDYVISGNIARVEDGIQGARRVVTNNVP